LVFSTLHTNDAPSAITRLIDMGVKPFLVASSIMAILAQRLMRILCTECKEPYEPTDVELRSVGLNRQRVEGNLLYKPVGCNACTNAGYKGRKGAFELMEMSADLREMAFKKKPTNQIRAKARAEGMVTLQDDGVRKVLAGITTIPEVLNITHSQG
jgi:type II secretory ATPase GspE/PulE/Tfp pilus assembly ATPase PilB-like protein